MPLALLGNLSPAELSRYDKQLRLPTWGRLAQERLKTGRVFVAGGSSLVATAAFYLVTAGVGHVRVVDQERVTLSDLGDQVLYRERDLNRPKALILQQRLQEVNPFVQVEGLDRKISEHTILKITAQYDLLLANFQEQRQALILNRAALKYRQPLLLGWLQEWRGYLLTLKPGQGRCLACTSLPAAQSGSQGLMAPLNAIIGGIMALEGLRILGGQEPALLERIFGFDGQKYECFEEALTSLPSCPICGRRHQPDQPTPPRSTS